MLLVVLTFVALLTPVAVFVAAAVRFGSAAETAGWPPCGWSARDGRAVRRIAAGEGPGGLDGRALLGPVSSSSAAGSSATSRFSQRSIFPADLIPSPALAALVVLAVPAAAVAVTLFTLRGVVIEPLGVVRTTTPGRRRVAWRLLMPLADWPALVPQTAAATPAAGSTSGRSPRRGSSPARRDQRPLLPG